MRSAMRCSSPVKLCTLIIRLAVSTSRSRSTWTAVIRAPSWRSLPEMRQDLLAEEPDLLVPVLAPQLEHHVRASRTTVLLDGRDAVVRRTGDGLALVEQRVRHLRFRGEPAALLHRLGDRADLILLDAGEVEQGVGRALDVLHLVGEIHAGDLARAVAPPHAIGRVDRRDHR